MDGKAQQMRRLLPALVALLLMTTPVAAQDFQKGTDAYKRGDYATAFREWIPLAEAGNIDAQFNLGVMYSNGLGVSQDYAEAAKWFRLAAEQGLAEAQFNLATLYARGLGVPADRAIAAKWLRKAASQGRAPAQYLLCEYYYKGLGVSQDHSKARKWCYLAAEQGLPDAQLRLFTLVNAPVESLMWLYIAAAQNHAAAQSFLQLLESETNASSDKKQKEIAEAQRLARAWLSGRGTRRFPGFSIQIPDDERWSTSRGFRPPAGTTPHRIAIERRIAAGQDYLLIVASVHLGEVSGEIAEFRDRLSKERTKGCVTLRKTISNKNCESTCRLTEFKSHPAVQCDLIFRPEETPVFSRSIFVPHPDNSTRVIELFHQYPTKNKKTRPELESEAQAIFDTVRFTD